MYTRTLLVLLVLFSVVNVAGAYSSQEVNSLLSSYNVSSGLIRNLSTTGITFQGSQYIALSSQNNIDFLVNVSSTPYLIVLNGSTIAAILRPELINQSLASVNTSSLVSQMQQFETANNAAKNLTACYNITGLNRFSCTLANQCQACGSVPLCHKYLDASGGPSGSFAAGVMLFSTEYTQLESNFTKFTSGAMTINGSNAGATVPQISSAYNSISSLTQSITHNPIFPPPAGVNYNLCTGAGNSKVNVSSPGGPWYCNSLPYCPTPFFQQSKLSSIQTTISQLESLPLTDPQIESLASNISQKENSYVLPILTARKAKELATTLNTTLSGYSTLIFATNTLLTHISNSTLAADESALMRNVSTLEANYLNLNITAYAANLSKQITSFSRVYASANATYSNDVKLARNNTALILELQLNTMAPSQSASSLGFQEAALETQLSSRISSISALNSNLLAINSQAAALGSGGFGDPFQELSRGIDAPIVRVMLGAENMPSAAAIASAPFYAMIPSLIIGLILLGLVFYKYNSLKHRHKLRNDPRTAANWRKLFAAAVILVAIYLAVTYSLAASASSFAPVSTFHSSLSASNTLVVALNGTTSTAMINCSGRIATAAKAINKSVQTLRISNATCLVGGTPQGLGTCLNPYLAKNTPVVVLTQGNSTHIGMYSYYGTILSATGNDVFMNSCPIAALIR
ncbi:MAG: hypothetical protein KGH72_01370 [Candidatus Micrarchaeota archaeon]|nr:hypothetical protein [Candidatus Micrarchaeota archaeon]